MVLDRAEMVSHPSAIVAPAITKQEACDSVQPHPKTHPVVLADRVADLRIGVHARRRSARGRSCATASISFTSTNKRHGGIRLSPST